MAIEPRPIPGLYRRGCLVGVIGAIAVSALLPLLLVVEFDRVYAPYFIEEWGVGLEILGSVLAIPLYLIIAVVPANLSGIITAWILGRSARLGVLSLGRSLCWGAVFGIVWGASVFPVYVWTSLTPSYSNVWPAIPSQQSMLPALRDQALLTLALTACVGLFQGWLLFRFIRARTGIARH
jgi:hypothetical protein